MNSIVRPFLMKFLVKKEICKSHSRQKCATKKGYLILQKKKKKGYLVRDCYGVPWHSFIIAVRTA